MIQGNCFYNQHKQKNKFNYNYGLHNFHTNVFTIIPSTITHFHEFYQQNITFEHNDQDMSNENIKTKWKIYENSTQSYSSTPPIRSKPHAQ
jgi:UDP-galactopyranose mutase